MERKTFNRKLSAVVKSAKTMRGNVQELIVAGLVHYADHADPTYLSLLVNACKDVSSLPTATINEYIQAHANVGWGKLKDGKKGYKKVGKELEVTMPEVTWYDWEGGRHNEVKANYAFKASIKRAITNAVKAHEENRIDAEDWEAAKKAAEVFGVDIPEEA